MKAKAKINKKRETLIKYSCVVYMPLNKKKLFFFRKIVKYHHSDAQNLPASHYIIFKYHLKKHQNLREKKAKELKRKMSKNAPVKCEIGFVCMNR